MILFAVGKQTNGWGGYQWQSYFVVAQNEAEAIELVDRYSGEGYWSNHPDPPTVVVVASSIDIVPGMPKIFPIDSLCAPRFFPSDVPTLAPLVI